MNIILNFLPMVLIYLIATYSPQVARISHTVLGKIIAIGLILLYAFFDTISGLFVCALVIFYYQSDYVESFSNEESEENNEDDQEEEQNKSDKKEKESFSTITKNEVLIFGEMNIPIKNPVKGHEEILTLSPGEALEDAYPLEPTITILNDKSAKDFRKKYCSKGHLLHKEQIVKPEMAEHVFPEIKQEDFHKCNICDPSCKFDIIPSGQLSDKLLKVEENLMKPKSSNDFFDVVWQNIQMSQ